MTRTKEPNRKRNTRESIEGRMVRDENGCLLWSGKVPETGYRRGYGSVNFDGRMWLVHRLVYTWHHGDIPAGMHVDHLCNVRNCCEITHLEAVTPSENSVRAGQRRKLCKNGHPYAQYRKRVSTTGESYCQACANEAATRRRRARGIKPRKLKSSTSNE